MNARFYDGARIVSADEAGIRRAPALLLELSGGFLGKDTVVRPATDEDKRTYEAEFNAYLEEKTKPAPLPPAPAEDKD